MMRAIIVDDEFRARQMLGAMLRDLCPNVQVVAACDDLPNGVKAIRRNAPDLVFLDIEMPGHSGLELLEFFNEDEVGFKVIFTTAYDHYAIRAFKLSAVDYLLKPISPEELTAAVDRVSKLKEQSGKQLQQLQQHIQHANGQKLAVPQMGGYRFIPHADILYLRGERAYTTIYLTDGTDLMASRSLKYFEELLMGDGRFFRCHRSYVINLDHVTEFQRTDGGTLMLDGDRPISVSVDKADELLARLRSGK